MKPLHYRFLTLTAYVIFATACTLQHAVTIDARYQPAPVATIEVGEIQNQTGQTYEVDVTKLLSRSLAEQLHKKQLLWYGGNDHKLRLDCAITQYEMGNAFKRWLLPFWGATELTVKGELKDGEQSIGKLEAHRYVGAGGLYTIGAWESVFNEVSEGLAEDLEEKLKQQK